MREWQIWVEGYRVTGNEAKASLLAEIEAETFDEAVEQYVASRPQEDANFFDKRSYGWAYWGCKLWPDEASARKAFG